MDSIGCVATESVVIHTEGIGALVEQVGEGGFNGGTIATEGVAGDKFPADKGEARIVIRTFQVHPS